MGKHYTSEEKGRALLLVREEVQEHGSGTKACSAAHMSPLPLERRQVVPPEAPSPPAVCLR